METGISDRCADQARTTRMNKATGEAPHQTEAQSPQKRHISKQSTQRAKPNGTGVSVTDVGQPRASVPSFALVHMVRGVDWLRRLSWLKANQQKTKGQFSLSSHHLPTPHSKSGRRDAGALTLLRNRTFWPNKRVWIKRKSLNSDE